VRLRLLVVVAIVFPALALLPSPTRACICDPIPSPLEAYEEADAVFLGTVTSVSEVREEPWVEFDAVTIWKGPISSTFLVMTTAPTTCSAGVYGVEIGVTYLVYVYDGYFGLGCDRFFRADEAAADIALFWAGHQVGQHSGYPNGGGGGLAAEPQSGFGLLAALVASGLTLVIAIGVCWKLRCRHRQFLR
jgi:hypothetical protein